MIPLAFQLSFSANNGTGQILFQKSISVYLVKLVAASTTGFIMQINGDDGMQFNLGANEAIYFSSFSGVGAVLSGLTNSVYVRRATFPDEVAHTIPWRTRFLNCRNVSGNGVFVIQILYS